MISIAAGGEFTVAARSDGTVWTLGDDGHGQLGDGPGDATGSTPVQAAGLAGVVRVGAGLDWAIACTSGGDLYTWGSDASGQLGNGAASTADLPAPTLASGFPDAAAGFGGDGGTGLVKSDGSIWTCGSNAAGRLGTAQPGSGATLSSDAPQPVTLP
jgi:alpha-tubulin suppressor-like RCC1 family protein